MPAELDIRDNGVAAYVGRITAWHRAGTVPSKEEADGWDLDRWLTEAGANFPVRTVPIYVRGIKVIGNGAEHFDEQSWSALGEDEETVDQFYELDNHRATMRMDRNFVLGAVGKRYTPLQNRDAFRVLWPLVEQKVAEIHTAGVLRQGRDVWVMAKFTLPGTPITQAAFGTSRGDGSGQVLTNCLVTNNHAGKREVTIQETPTDVVCANTLAAALSAYRWLKLKGRAFGIRHTASVEAKMAEAAMALLHDVIARYEVIGRQYMLLRRTFLDEAMFRRLVLDAAAPIPERLQKPKLSSREEKSRTRLETMRERLDVLWRTGDGHVGDRTAWEAYAAVAQSVDHDDTVWKVKRDDPAKRIEALWEGRLGGVKNDVLDGLVAHAAQMAVAQGYVSKDAGGDDEGMGVVDAVLLDSRMQVELTAKAAKRAAKAATA